jgi:hypothetical protein
VSFKNHLILPAALAVLLAVTLNATTPVSITSTNINSSKVLTVHGSGFAPTGTAPTFTFNGHTLTVKSFTNTSVAATLPSTTSQGSYQVTIRNSQGQSATVSTTYDVDSADVDPALVTNSTLKGKGTSASPLGIKVPLTLNSPGNGNPALILNGTDNNSTAEPGVALEIYESGIDIQSGTISALSFGQIALIGNGPNGGTGVSGNGSFAIYGTACCDDDLAIAGIYGDSGGFANSVAGSFHGNVDITGKLTKAGGSFKIDHPLDPANKYLSHSFVESPDMMNVYNGNIATDGTGNATVTLPDWFEALNRDFRYQLTVIGQFAQAVIAQEVTHNQFIIRTDKPSVKVSWQITGIRQDAWANAHRIPVEEAKPDKEREFYLHPELFNQPPEKGIEWARHPEQMKKHAEMMNKATQHTAQ